MKPSSVRLSKFVTPLRYKIFLKPDFDRFIFHGTVDVQVDLSKTQNVIVLHSKELQIFSAQIDSHEVKFKLDSKKEQLTLIPKKVLSKGRHSIKIDFEGVLNDLLRGFYRSKYSHEGEDKWIATTQFEATDARRCIPCFDEPDKKAIFDVTLMVPKTMEAISNTLPRVVKEHDEHYKLVEFAPSPKMSTYLLAFIVGEFEYIEKKTKRGVLVRVFTTPGKKEQGRFALDTGVKCVEFFEKYFGIKYPLPVLDMIAIPDFSSGAMENWGAVTYRESALLFDIENSSSINKQWVALVVAHEIAHQWFGNLATMEWWTHLWLNEGFATYMEYVAIDAIYPRMRIFEQFVNHEMSAALSLDQLTSTHPIEVEVHHPDEISEIFDEVSYAKGSCVIRMLAEYLGEKDFKKGLTAYLKGHSYKNARTEDLWRAFQRASGKNVDKMMAAWTGKPGYPMIKITEKPKTLSLTQNRYFANKSEAKKNKDKTIWQVPITVLDQKSGKTNKFLLDRETKEIAKPAGGVKFNTKETSLARFDYPSQVVEKINISKISPIDRIGLVRDMFALCTSLDFPVLTYLSELEKFRHEKDYNVWIEITSGLSWIRRLVTDQDFASEYDKFALDILEEIKDDYSLKIEKGEDHVTTLSRNLILGSRVNFGDKGLIAKAKKLFTQADIPADLRAIVYTAVAKSGKISDFDEMIKRHQKAELTEEKNRILRAICSFEDPKLAKRTIEYLFTDNVRTQDRPLFFSILFGNPSAQQPAWQYIKDNYSSLHEQYGKGGMLLSRFIQPLAGFYTDEQYKDIKEFFKKKSLSSAKLALSQALERIEIKSMWRKENLPHLRRKF